MPSTDFKNFIIKRLEDQGSNIDLSPGSNFRDLFVNPLSVIFDEYQNEHDRIVNNLSLTDPTQLSEEELDAIGARYLVSRNGGSYAQGEIQIYYVEPQPLSIPVGSRFVNERTGVEYETVSAYNATRFRIRNNGDPGSSLYRTDPIPVRSVTKVKEGNLSVGSPLASKTVKTPSPEQILVSGEITGGTPREDNQTYYDRIKSSVRNATLASKEVIRTNVKAQNSDVDSVEVIGAGDSLMTRDLVEKGSLDPAKVEDFQYVDRGQADNGYYRGHKAFLDTFTFKVSTQSGSDDVVWPSNGPSDWVTEFTSDQYKGIYKKADGLDASTDQYKILNITSFSQDAFDGFEYNDGINKNGELIWPSEIRLEGSSAVLGKTPDTDSIDTRISKDDLEQLEVDLEDGINQKEFDLINSVLKQIKEKKKPEEYANSAPIFHKPLNQHTGITIETTMATTDKTESGEMAYITVLRNDEIYLPHDGYGLAWRKQPQFLIRLNNDSYSDPDQRDEDIQTFEDHFGVNPETEGVIGSLSDPANDQYWFYNVYLVDNDVLQEEVQLGYNAILDQSSGRNQFLQMSKYWIEPDTTYDFKLQITENLGTKVWTRESGVSASYDLKIDRGATYPSYVPNAGEKVTSENSDVQSLNAERGNFGIGVGETKSYEWRVDSIVISSIIQSFPMQLFRFKVDTTKWPSASAPFDVDYYGVGYDPDLFSADGSGHSRTQAAIWNPGTSSWDKLGEHTAETVDPMDDRKIEKSFTDLSTYMDTDDYIHIAASAANFGTNFPNDTNHNLESYYIELRNPQANKKHLHNAIDVYCHAPDSVSRKASSTLTINNGEVILNDPYIQDIIEVQEANSSVTFDKTEYTLFNNAEGEEFSKDNQIKIAFDPSFDGTQIIVIYRQWTGGSQINSYLNSSENRYPGVTIKEKIMPPAVVHVDKLEYKGNIEEQNAKEALRDFINSIEEGDPLEKSDLVDVLYDLGATYVDLDIDIRIKQYYTNLTSEEKTPSQSYRIPTSTKSRFFATDITLSGVANV